MQLQIIVNKQITRADYEIIIKVNLKKLKDTKPEVCGMQILCTVAFGMERLVPMRVTIML